MMLQWLGAFAFGPSMLVYRGRAADNSPHAHASIPLSVAQTGTLSILDGISLSLRPVAAGLINFDVLSVLTQTVGFVPIAFIVLIIVLTVRPAGIMGERVADRS